MTQLANSPLSPLANTRKDTPLYARDEKREYVGDPWSRQPREPAKAYSAFQIYLSLDPDKRTFTETDRQYRERNNLPSTTSTKRTQMSYWSKKHRWLERAEAYDNYVAAKLRAATERRKVRAAIKHADQAEAVLDILTSPAMEIRRRAEEEGLDLVKKMSDADLIKMVKVFAPDIAGMQRAERDALSAATESGPAIDHAKVAMRAERLRKVMENPNMIGTMERITIEVVNEEQRELAEGTG